MKFDTIIHKDVNWENPEVVTEGAFSIDQVGKMIWIATPINDKNEVHVTRVIFDSIEELNKVLNQMHFYYK